MDFQARSSHPAEFSSDETFLRDPSSSGYTQILLQSGLNIQPERFYLQLSSIRMKSLMPKFSRKTPEDEVVLKRKEMSALSSPWNVGKCRYDVSLSKNAAFQTFSAKLIEPF